MPGCEDEEEGGRWWWGSRKVPSVFAECLELISADEMAAESDGSSSSSSSSIIQPDSSRISTITVKKRVRAQRELCGDEERVEKFPVFPENSPAYIHVDLEL